MAGEEGGGEESSHKKHHQRQPSGHHEQHHVTVVDDRSGAGNVASDSDADEAEEILEESTDKRWSKRREKVKQRDVPGIDAAYLAMDNETGNEVVWNEVQFSERKNFRDQEEKLKSVFDKLTHLVHVNLVKFHKYWTDTKSEKPRIIFITEYMSSGSMSRFLQRARSSGSLLSIKAWKKWNTQILSALQYLHSCDPPIVHANLTCNTIFIQQNGLIKIGCVAPNAIHHHVKTFRENLKNIHYTAPDANQATTQADIYSFGICALEMASTGALQDKCNGVDPSSCSNTTTSFNQGHVTPESIRKAIDALEDSLQKDFIEKCLQMEPHRRPSARELLFHPVLFEVHSLKLISAHAIVRSKLADQLGEDDLHVQDGSKVMASSKFKQVTYAELPTFQVDLDKFLEDVRNGIYPLSAFGPLAHLPIKTTKKFASSPSLSNIANADSRTLSAGANGTHLTNETGSGLADSAHPSTSTTSKTDAGGDEHHRGGYDQHDNSSTFSSSGALTEGSVASTVGGAGHTNSLQHQHKDGYTGGAGGNTSLCVSERDEGYHTGHMGHGGALSMPAGMGGGETRLILRMHASMDGSSLQVLLQLDDHMNRQLTTEIGEQDTANNLVIELVQHGFISESDSQKMCSMLTEVLEDARGNNNNKQHGLNSPA